MLFRKRKTELIGPKDTLLANRIRELEVLSTEGNEGDVVKAEVTFDREGQEQTEHFALKKFRRQKPTNDSPTENSRYQFESMKRLVDLNDNEQLGLNIIPTFRVVKSRKRNPDLLLTLLKPEDVLDATELKSFNEDMQRQTEAARKHDWRINIDSFIPIRNEQGKVNAVIADFGSVFPPREVMTEIRKSL